MIFYEDSFSFQDKMYAKEIDKGSPFESIPWISEESSDEEKDNKHNDIEIKHENEDIEELQEDRQNMQSTRLTRERRPSNYLED